MEPGAILVIRVEFGSTKGERNEGSQDRKPARRKRPRTPSMSLRPATQRKAYHADGRVKVGMDVFLAVWEGFGALFKMYGHLYFLKPNTANDTQA
jgi:hypothetical protein